jgi:hypothetical protein
MGKAKYGLRGAALVGVGALLLTACGGGGNDNSTSGSGTPTTGGTITFLPPELRPYRRYSVRIIGTTLRQLRRGVSYADLEVILYDPDRFPDFSTVRRWCRAFPRPPTTAAS